MLPPELFIKILSFANDDAILTIAFAYPQFTAWGLRVFRRRVPFGRRLLEDRDLHIFDGAYSEETTSLILRCVETPNTFFNWLRRLSWSLELSRLIPILRNLERIDELILTIDKVDFLRDPDATLAWSDDVFLVAAQLAAQKGCSGLSIRTGFFVLDHPIRTQVIDFHAVESGAWNIVRSFAVPSKSFSVQSPEKTYSPMISLDAVLQKWTDNMSNVLDALGTVRAESLGLPGVRIQPSDSLVILQLGPSFKLPPAFVLEDPCSSLSEVTASIPHIQFLLHSFPDGLPLLKVLTALVSEPTLRQVDVICRLIDDGLRARDTGGDGMTLQLLLDLRPFMPGWAPPTSESASHISSVYLDRVATITMNVGPDAHLDPKLIGRWLTRAKRRGKTLSMLQHVHIQSGKVLDDPKWDEKARSLYYKLASRDIHFQKTQLEEEGDSDARQGRWIAKLAIPPYETRHDCVGRTYLTNYPETKPTGSLRVEDEVVIFC